MFIIYVIDIYQPKINCKDGGSYFYEIKNADRWKLKKNFFS